MLATWTSVHGFSMWPRLFVARCWQALSRLEQPVTRRQLAAAAGVAPGDASEVIEDLIRAGLVNEAVAGRSSMVVLNIGSEIRASLPQRPPRTAVRS